MRAMLPNFTNRSLRDGPFVFNLTDLNQSNIFVDQDWNITSIIDLEWACVRPLEMLSPPLWLTSKKLDEISSDDPDEYAALHTDFVNVFAEEELARHGSAECTELFRSNWKSGAFWYLSAIQACPSSLLAVYLLQPRFASIKVADQKEFDSMLFPFWNIDARDVIVGKVEEQERYIAQLQSVFIASGDVDKQIK